MNFKKAAFAIAGFTIALSAFAAPGKALVIGSKTYTDTFAVWLGMKGYSVDKSTQKNTEKEWKRQGYVVPGGEELSKYKLVVITPLANVESGHTETIVNYVKNGGIFMMNYDALNGTHERTKEFGFGICGFDKIKQQFLRPYPKAGPMTHKFKYTGKMGKKHEFEIKTLMTYYASDLVDAEPLIVNEAFPGLAIATVTQFDKGKFIYFGSENRQCFYDIIDACAPAK